MHRGSFFLLLIGIIEVIQCGKIESPSNFNDASVAVLDCTQKHPNVYFDISRKEWMVHSYDTRCYQSNDELLDLCRMTYPDLNVQNVMRMNEPVKFTVYACSTNDNFEAKVLSLENSRGCSKLLKKSVMPYKCLHGDYQAENLYIPPKCLYQHLIINEGCQSQDHLNLLAAEKCKLSEATVNSSILLKWCDGVATFTGIEFVCCPNKYDFIATDKNYEDEDIDDDYDGYDEKSSYDFGYDDYNDVYSSNENEKKVLYGAEEKFIDNQKEDFNKITPTQMAEVQKLNEMKKDMNKLNANEFIENFNKVLAIVQAFDVAKEEESDLEAVEGTREQKEQYEKQKHFIITSIQNSTENLIKEKQSTTAYLTGSKDDKNNILYEPMLRNLDDQYQVRFDRLNKEKERLLLQEEISYEQQVQGRLNEKKLNTVKDLNRNMQEQEHKSIPETNLEALVGALNDFLIAQENDRLHMVSVYKKLKAYFPEQVYERSQSIINHLDSIDKTINETTSIFTLKFKLLSKCILPILREHLSRYNQVRTDSKTIRNELKNLQSNHIVTDLRSTKSPMVDLGKSNGNVVQDMNLNSKNTKFEYYDDDIYDNDDYNIEENDSKIDNDEAYEDGDDYDYIDSEESYENYDDIETNKKDNINIKRLNGKSSSISSMILIAAVLLGIFFSLLLMYVLVRRKRLRTETIVKHGFLPVDTTNPEDRHINNMQTNGYENPTYKYFENNVQA